MDLEKGDDQFRLNNQLYQKFRCHPGLEFRAGKTQGSHTFWSILGRLESFYKTGHKTRPVSTYKAKPHQPMLMAPHKVSAHFAASFPGGLCCPHAFLITLGHNSSYIWSYSFEDIILIKIPGGLCCPEQRHMPFLSSQVMSPLI